MVPQVIESNATSYSIPKWLDEQFLEENLRNHYKTDVKVINFVAKSTAGKGENFSSSLYRVCVTFSFTSKSSSMMENSVRFCEN